MPALAADWLAAGGQGPGVSAEDAGLGVDALLVLAAVAAAAVGQGGYYRGVREAGGAMLVLAALVLLSRRALVALRSARWTLAGLAVMAACTVVAGLLDGHLAGALAALAVLLALAVLVAVSAVSVRSSRGQLADSVLVLGVSVAVLGWLGVAFHLEPFGDPNHGLWRAATTVTYANAAAAILGPLALWSLARGSVRPGWPTRAASVLLVAGLGATLSRAGVASFLAGALVLGVLLGFRPMLRTGGPALLGGAIVDVGLVPGMTAGGPAMPVWAVIGLLTGLGVGIGPWPSRVLGSTRRAGFGRRWLPALLVCVSLAAAAGTVGVVLAGHSRLWSPRFGLSSPSRASLTSVAVGLWRSHFLAGVGPGRAVFIWTTADHRLVFDRYAHDEYLQLAVEQGVIGLAGLGVLGVGIAATIAQGWRSGSRARSRSGRQRDLTTLRAGAVAGLVCLALHSGFDFLWHVPAVLMIAALATGLAAPAPVNELLNPPPKEVVCPASDG
jgi:hypothetical protein